MANVIQVPATVAGVKAELAGIEGLVTAKQWQRAAIVYAFTKGDGRSAGRMSAAEFARLGIAGLRSPDTVKRWRQTWQRAVDDGLAADIAPGDQVKLPDAVFEDRHDADQTRYVSKGAIGKRLREDPSLEQMRLDVVREALADPDLAAKLPAWDLAQHAARPDVARAINRNDETREAVEEASIEYHGTHARQTDEKADELTASGVGDRFAKQTGSDKAVSSLRQAARIIADAVHEKELFGVEHPGAESEAIDDIFKAVALYQGVGDLTKSDREWLASVGIGQ